MYVKLFTMCSEEGSIQMKADRLHRIYGNKKNCMHQFVRSRLNPVVRGL